MKKDSKIYISGHCGMVGSAIKRHLEKNGYNNLICKTKAELDLLNQTATREFFDREKPEYVFHAAAKVGGIKANDLFSADYIYENLTIESNVIYNAFRLKVKKLLFLGSSCIYPKNCLQPIKEEYFFTGPLEKTNEAYALAKIAGVMMCQMYRKQYGCDFISVMPTNLYGINDDYHPENSHVVPAMIRRFYEGKLKNNLEAICWGTSTPYRELLYVDDLADACLFLMLNYSEFELINVGTGEDITIKNLADLIAKIVGFKGTIKWDASSPDGTMRKRLNVSKLQKLGWKHRWKLDEGLKLVFQDFLNRFHSN